MFVLVIGEVYSGVIAWTNLNYGMQFQLLNHYFLIFGDEIK